MARQGLLVREACVSVLVGGAGFFCLFLGIPSGWDSVLSFLKVLRAQVQSLVGEKDPASCQKEKRKKKNKNPVLENGILLHALGKVDLKVLE